MLPLTSWYRTPVSFTLDASNMDRFARDLAHKMPALAAQASSAALNRTARGAELLSKKNVKASMTQRNKWTLGSIKSTRTPRTRAMARQFVLVGSKQSYMRDQEKGVVLGKTKAGRRLTTARGSREGATAFPRRSVAKGRFAARNIKIAGLPHVRGSRGRRAKVAVEMARRAKKKWIFLRLSRDKAGLFAINKNSIHMVHAIMRRSARLRANPWLAPAVDKSRRIAPTVFRLELTKVRRMHMNDYSR